MRQIKNTNKNKTRNEIKLGRQELNGRERKRMKRE